MEWWGVKVLSGFGKPSLASSCKFSAKPNCSAQVPLEADRIVEPCDEQVVHMLDVLPEDEGQFYACEENLVECTGKKKQCSNKSLSSTTVS